MSDELRNNAVSPWHGSTPALGGPRAAAAAHLSDLTDRWLARQLSKHTRTAYRRDLLGWLGWCAAAGVDPLRARPADVDAWIVQQRLIGARGSRPAAESTIARRVAAVGSWYAYLLLNTAYDEQPLATHNPVLTAGRPRIDPDDSTTVGLSRDEAEQLIEQARLAGPDTYALILLLLLTGARVGAAIGAQIEHLGHHRGHRILDLVTKGSKRAREPLPAALATAIDAMLEGRGNPAEGPLFVTPAGAQIYELYVHRLIRRLARAAGIPAAEKLSPHSLRHTAITEVLNVTNGNLRRAQYFAGHVDPRTTLRYDRDRDQLDGHPAYLLAGHYATDGPPQRNGSS